MTSNDPSNDPRNDLGNDLLNDLVKIFIDPVKSAQNFGDNHSIETFEFSKTEFRWPKSL